MNIGIYHNEYGLNMKAIENNVECKVFDLLNWSAEEEIPPLDVLILQVNSFHHEINVIKQFKKRPECVVIGWQTGIWNRVLCDYVLDLLLMLDSFMGYDIFIEAFAKDKLGIHIWEEYPLMSEITRSIQAFDPVRSQKKYLFACNKVHSHVIGYSAIYAEMFLEDYKWVTYGHRKGYFGSDHDADDHVTMTRYPWKNVEFRIGKGRELFLDEMDRDCKAVAQLHSSVSWGRIVCDATLLGIPSFCDSYYQRLFYPDLTCRSWSEIMAQLERDYNDFEPFVEQAQETLCKLDFATPSNQQRFANYFMETVEALRK